MDAQLQQLIELQQEQNQLLKRHLWRLRFSLFSLLIMTTVTAIVLGYVAYQTRPTASVAPLPAPAPIRVVVPPAYTPPLPAAPNGDINLRPSIPGQA
jgi:hypothetical protein